MTTSVLRRTRGVGGADAIKKTWKVGIKRLRIPMARLVRQTDQQQGGGHLHTNIKAVLDDAGYEARHVANGQHIVCPKMGIALNQPAQAACGGCLSRRAEPWRRSSENCREACLGWTDWDRRPTPWQGRTVRQWCCPRYAEAANMRRVAPPINRAAQGFTERSARIRSAIICWHAVADRAKEGQTRRKLTTSTQKATGNG